MTTPGGVPNLPVGALTLPTLSSKLEDMSEPAMRARAGERWPSIFDSSSGGNLLSDLSPAGIIGKLFAGFQSVVANADPSDIDGPEDLPGLLLDFIEELPVIGELVGLLEAIIGEYHGDDEVLLAIQDIFMPLRRMVQLVSGNDVDWPTLGELESGWSHLFGAIGGKIEGLLSGLIDISWLTDQHQNLILESGYDSAVTVVAEDDPAITQDATDGVPDTDPLGCLRIALDGQQHYRIGELIAVGKGWELQVASRVKRESVSASAGSIRVELQPYSRAGDVVTPVGGRVSVCSVAAPGGSSSGWPESISGSWSVPSDGSVTHISVIPGVTAGAASGVVKFDNTTMFATQNIPQAFVNELTEDLDSLLNWIQTVVDTLLTRLGLPPTGSLLDRIHDLGDEIQLMQEQGEDALAGLADKLGLTDWNAHLAELLSNPGAVLGQLGMGKVTGLLDFQATQNQIRDILAGEVVTPINSVVQDVKDWFAGLGNKVQNLTSGGNLPPTSVSSPLGGSNLGQDVVDTVNDLVDGWTKFWNGIFRTPGDTTPRTAPEVQAAAESISTAVSGFQHTQDVLASTILLPRKQPLWVSKWPDDDVAFPVTMIDGVITPGLNTLFLIPITATVDRVYQSVKFALGTLTMTQCFVGVYSVDTETGQADLISNLGDVKSQLSSSFNQQSLELPEEISANKGTNLYVGILQVGGTSASFYQSSNDVSLSDYPTSHPQFIGARLSGSTTTLPSTISASNIVFGPRLWAAIGYGVSPPPPPKTYFLDNFNRANGGLGSNWIDRFNGFNINSQVAVGQQGLNTQVSTPVTQFTTAEQFIRANVSENKDIGLVIRASPSMLVYAILSSSNPSMRIYTHTSWNTGVTGGSGTARATSTPAPLSPSGSYAIELSAVGSLYTLKRISGSNSNTLTWNDTGGIVPLSNRIGGMWSYGGGKSIDNFEMYDL